MFLTKSATEQQFLRCCVPAKNKTAGAITDTWNDIKHEWMNVVGYLFDIVKSTVPYHTILMVLFHAIFNPRRKKFDVSLTPVSFCISSSQIDVLINGFFIIENASTLP